VALCERCGEEIAVANDLDRAGDVDPRVGGKPRRLPGGHRVLFKPLYGHRGDVVYANLCRALSGAGVPGSLDEEIPVQYPGVRTGSMPGARILPSPRETCHAE
jgi:hypothetical protein